VTPVWKRLYGELGHAGNRENVICVEGKVCGNVKTSDRSGSGTARTREHCRTSVYVYMISSDLSCTEST